MFIRLTLPSRSDSDCAVRTRGTSSQPVWSKVAHFHYTVNLYRVMDTR